jgi:hypothetical protein
MIYFECDNQDQLVFSFMWGVGRSSVPAGGSGADIGFMSKNSSLFLFRVRPSIMFV